MQFEHFRLRLQNPMVEDEKEGKTARLRIWRTKGGSGFGRILIKYLTVIRKRKNELATTCPRGRHVQRPGHILELILTM